MIITCGVVTKKHMGLAVGGLIGSVLLFLIGFLGDSANGREYLLLQWAGGLGMFAGAIICVCWGAQVAQHGFTPEEEVRRGANRSVYICEYCGLGFPTLAEAERHEAQCASNPRNAGMGAYPTNMAAPMTVGAAPAQFAAPGYQPPAYSGGGPGISGPPIAGATAGPGAAIQMTTVQIAVAQPGQNQVVAQPAPSGPVVMGQPVPR